MWEILSEYAFLVGAGLLIGYQAMKFGEVNAADPTTSRYIGMLPSPKVRDFAGPHAYLASLGACLAASFIAYFLVCQVPPDILKGALKLANIEPPEGLQSTLFPIYLAILLIGLAQTRIPILSQFETLQRNFFHNRIEVPRRVIELSGVLTRAIELRTGADKRRLSNEVKNLANGDFLTGLQSYGDGIYYKLQLDNLKLGDEDDIERRVSESSIRELRELIERLVLCALVAVMRRSGPTSLPKVAEALDVRVPPLRTNDYGRFVASVLASSLFFFVALVALANIFWWLCGPIAALLSSSSMWPNDFSAAALELGLITLPVFVSVSLAVFLLVPRGQSETADVGAEASSLGADFVKFVHSSSSVLVMCVGITVLIYIGQLFYEYGTAPVPLAARSPSKLILVAFQGLIPVAVSLFTTWYLVTTGARPTRRGLSFAATMAAIAGTTGFIAFTHDFNFVQGYVAVHPDAAPGWEHVLFAVAANVLVSVCAFASTVLFFATCDKLPAAIEPRQQRVEERAQEISENPPPQPRRPSRNVYRRAQERVNTNPANPAAGP
jgi:hypothetical protein